YQWQAQTPASPDLFEATLTYLTSSGPQVVSLVSQSSLGQPFNSTISFSALVPLIDLVNGLNNGTITFTLDENNTGVGTRIELDNVAVTPSFVPEASTVVTWSVLAGLGLVAGIKKKLRR